MTKRIIYPNSESPYNVIIVCPAFNSIDRTEEDTDEDCLALALYRLKTTGRIKEDTPYKIVEDSELPTDHRYFNAWRYDDGVYIDMEEARSLHMQFIREARDRVLEDLDNQSLRAFENDDSQTLTALKVRKAILRDLPQTFSLYTPNDTIEELSALWPEELTI